MKITMDHFEYMASKGVTKVTLEPDVFDEFIKSFYPIERDSPPQSQAPYSTVKNSTVHTEFGSVELARGE